MHKFNRNSNKKSRFKFFELLGLFCFLFLLFAFSFKNQTFNFSKQKIENDLSFLKSQHSTYIHSSATNAVHQSEALYDICLEEESEFENESVEEEPTIGFSTKTLSRLFNFYISRSSFANFSHCLQKRVVLPFFILHHSWKIPSV